MLTPDRWLQDHPNPHLQTSWKLTQMGLMALPFSTLVGGLSLVMVAVMVWWRYWPSLIRRPLLWGLGILALWLLLSATQAELPGEAYLGLFNFWPYFFVFAALGELIQTPAQVRRIAWILVLGSLPVVLIGLVQLYPGWGGHVQLLWIVIDWVLPPGGNPSGRMASVFTYANVLASYLIVPFIFAIGLAMTPDSQPDLKDNQPHPYLRWLLGLSIVANGLALLLTNSRNGWGIVLLAGLAFAVYLGWHWLVALVGAAGTIVLGAAFAPSPLQQWCQVVVPRLIWARLNDQLYPDRPIALMRSTQWQFAWSLTQQRPWTGWGLRNFTPLYQQQMGLWLGHPHNLFLMMTAETGLPAALLLFGWVGWVVLGAVIYLIRWPEKEGQTGSRHLYFSLLLAFLACTLFHLSDITLFDARINSLGWVLLASLWGLPRSQKG